MLGKGEGYTRRTRGGGVCAAYYNWGRKHSKSEKQAFHEPGSFCGRHHRYKTWPLLWIWFNANRSPASWGPKSFYRAADTARDTYSVKLLCRRKGFWCRFFCCWTTSLLWRHIKRPCDPPDPIILSRSYDNKAYTINFTYQNGMLTMYITHPTPSSHAGRSTEYHMNRLRPYLLTDTLESFRAGAAAVRNACIWAKRQRNLFIESANETAQAVPSNVSFEASTRTKVPGESSWNRCKARLVSVVLSQI